MDGHPMQGLVVISGFILLSAVITAAKTALEYVNEAEVSKRAGEGDKRAIRVQAMLKLPHRYINLVHTMAIAFGLLTGMIYAGVVYGYLKELFHKAFFETYLEGSADFWMIFIGILLAYFIALFGKLFPRKLAIRYADTYAYSLSGLLRLLTLIFLPFIGLLEVSTNLLLRLFQINPSELLDNVTEDEIISIVNEGHEQGVLEAEEAEMISNIIEFNEKIACDIMTHRMKMIAINAESSVEEALRFMLTENLSRYPLYQGDIDNIVGILHLRDMMLFYMNPELKDASLTQIARKPYFVPDTQGIDVLFRDMQSKKVHMAIAIDEYGQTAGLVAMEDILEEIVGDIQDEYDYEEEMILPMKEGRFLVHGEVKLIELADVTGILFLEEDMEKFDTLNGFLISRLEHIPEDGEAIIIDYAGYRFCEPQIKNKVIQSVCVYKLEEGKQEEESELLESAAGDMSDGRGDSLTDIILEKRG